MIVDLKLIIIFFLLLAYQSFLSAFPLEDFEPGKEFNSGGWHFGNLSTVITPVDSEHILSKYSGKRVLHITGISNDWYVGGWGKSLFIDGAELTNLHIMIKGNGYDSGRIKIELYDDDNGNEKLEQDSEFIATKDDRWSIYIPVTWDHWKTMIIPITKFKDDNPGIGDDIWNPDKSNKSGGLLVIQFVLLTNRRAEKVEMFIDDIFLF